MLLLVSREFGRGGESEEMRAVPSFRLLLKGVPVGPLQARPSLGVLQAVCKVPGEESMLAAGPSKARRLVELMFCVVIVHIFDIFVLG